MAHLCCQVIFSAKGLAKDKTNHLVLFLSVLILVIVQLLEGLTGELVVLRWQHPLRIPLFCLQLIEISLWTLLKAQCQLERHQRQPPAIIIVCTSCLQRHTPMTQSLLQILKRLEWECEYVFHTYFFFFKDDWKTEARTFDNFGRWKIADDDSSNKPSVLNTAAGANKHGWYTASPLCACVPPPLFHWLFAGLQSVTRGKVLLGCVYFLPSPLDSSLYPITHWEISVLTDRRLLTGADQLAMVCTSLTSPAFHASWTGGPCLHFPSTG